MCVCVNQVQNALLLKKMRLHVIELFDIALVKYRKRLAIITKIKFKLAEPRAILLDR